eukprot:TRINITY_DN19005_c0_g1_i1.p1 TRINITY_DN19005_c0_g1~~TRINITY_DN19005_c0_g1_i1.p1  ORF type:complete len:220 (+),score=28.15 TRINITY_DN19005_c0_g1_i1:71-730(+)
MGILQEVMTTLSRNSTWVYIAFAIHFSLCMIMIVAAPGDRVLQIGGTTLSPKLQWANTSFCLFSVFCIIQALIGTIYMLESHLNTYFYLLAVSLVVDVGYLVTFIQSGISAIGVAVVLALSIVFKLLAQLVISKHSKVLRNQYNAELLPHLKSAMSRSFGSFGSERESPMVFAPAASQQESSFDRYAPTPPGTNSVPPATQSYTGSASPHLSAMKAFNA